jgi:hypothetical protein
MMKNEQLKRELDAFPVMMSDIPGKGRGLIATSDIVSGTVLVRETPVLLVQAEDSVIGVVESAFFQLIGLPEHVFTTVLMKLSGLYPSNQIVDTAEPTAYVNAGEAELLHIMAARLLDAQVIPPEKMQHITHLLGLPSDSANLRLLLVILRLTMTGIFDEWETEKVGEALVVIPALMNHSCYPNSSLFFHPATSPCEVRANRDLAKGEEICFPYTALYEYTRTRQQDLRDNYGFLCQCPRCLNDPSCPSQLDRTPSLLKTPLSVAKQTETAARLEQLYVDSEQRYFQEYWAGDTRHATSRHMAEAWLRQAHGFYAPLHPSRFKMTEFLGRVNVEAGDYSAALTYYEHTIQMMDRVFPEFWFRKSCALGCLEKLYRRLGQHGDAQKTEQRRHQLLTIVRGTDTWDDGSDEVCAW